MTKLLFLAALTAALSLPLFLPQSAEACHRARRAGCSETTATRTVTVERTRVFQHQHRGKLLGGRCR